MIGHRIEYNGVATINLSIPPPGAIRPYRLQSAHIHLWMFAHTLLDLDFKLRNTGI